MRLKIFSLAFLFIFCTGSLFSQSVSKYASEAHNLIKRTIGANASNFITEAIKTDAGKDYFEIDKRGHQVLLRGTSGVAIASSFNYYLRHIANCQVTWNGSNLKLPSPLPLPAQKIIKNTPYDYRYYLNFCTFNYSMSWWNWDRWQTGTAGV